jgi:Tfp pilus assembly protein PilF
MRGGILGALALGLALLAAGCSMPRITVHDDPLSADEHLRLGMAYEAKGDLDAAAAEYGKAMHREPLARLYLGNVFYARGKLPEAEAEYRAALERLPGNPEVRNNLAWVLLKRGRALEEAQALAEAAVAAAPSEAARKAYRDTLDAIRAARAAPQ